jgi:uncharacterized protein YqgC (DUF456 family)
MIDKFNTYTIARPRLRKVFGWVLVVFGFFALITPLTPGGLLFFVGLEVLGWRFVFTDKIKGFFIKEKFATPLIDPLPQEKLR